MPMKINIELSREQAAMLRRPIHGSGGWQSLLKVLQSRLNGEELSLSPQEVAKILRYKSRYGQGGFQDRLDGVISQAESLAREIIKALELNSAQDITNFMAGQKPATRRGGSRILDAKKKAQ